MEKGDLFKITSNGYIYFGIFVKSLKRDNVFYAILDCEENKTGLSGKPKLPVPKIHFRKGTKIRKWKPKTFDRKISSFGLAVRDGKFYDRMSISEQTVNALCLLFTKIRERNASIYKYLQKL